ncbi:hypothetical protein RHGRI_014824 [Rhododendron griersonianum]|uniref:Uncharacterized protein n=1 Tax=Rhododendron griersonianum TaxID=479676 RepID=A0AAV6KB00_9ERIC|nr:hypothetical protein RHGRI_014824 [Rhododendron griersonianum]
MTVPVEEAIAALSTFSLEVKKIARSARIQLAYPKYIKYTDVSAYRLSLSEDTKALNQLNTHIHEGKDMTSVLYTYQSNVKALPQVRTVLGLE